MASSSSAACSASASASASVLEHGDRNREAIGPVAVAPPAPLPPPPPVQEVHAVYLEQLFRVRAEPRGPPPLPLRDLPFLCRVATWVLLVFLLTVMFSFVLWVIFHPNFPQLHVGSGSMSNISISSAAVTAECNVTLLLTNTNRHLAATYERMEISLIYPSQRVLLAQYYGDPFVQPGKNHTAIETSFSFSDIYLGNDVVEAMKRDVKGGSLSLGIKVLAIVSYRNGKWITHSQFMRAYCGELIFGFSSSGKPGAFSNPIRECEVYLYSR